MMDRRWALRRGLAVVGLGWGLAWSGHALAEEITLYAAAGVKAPAEELVRDFERQTGHTVQRVYDTAGAAEQRFADGGKRGLLITAQARLHRAPYLAEGVQRAVGDTVAGVAVATSFARLPIGTSQGLREALLSARRIAFSDPARGATVGTHFLHVIDQLGIRDEVLAKSVKARDGIETMKLVMSGEVDLGITQVSEIMQADASTLLGPFPRAFDLSTRYSLWFAQDAAPAVKALADLFTSEAGRAGLLQHGLRLP